MKLIIPQELTDLNTYINQERDNRYAAADTKKTMTDICTMYALNYAKKNKIQPLENKATMRITWYCKNQKKDPDNISFAKKFILDGLVKAGVLQNDGWQQIQGFEDVFEVDKDKPRVEIELREVSQ